VSAACHRTGQVRNVAIEQAMKSARFRRLQRAARSSEKSRYRVVPGVETDGLARGQRFLWMAATLSTLLCG